jgi:hypothetical protein
MWIGYIYPSGDAANIHGDGTPDSFNDGPYYRYWTQDFSRRNFVFPVVISREADLSTSGDVNIYVSGGTSLEGGRLQNGFARIRCP